MGNTESKRDAGVYNRFALGVREMPVELVKGKRRDVERVNLNCNKLSGPVEIPALPRLSSILLWGNDITGCVWPPNHVRLDALRVLDLGSNRLHEVPKGISVACPKLTELNLAFNDITELSAEIAECTSIAVLKVQHNKLVTIPAAVFALPRLQSLDAHDNQLASIPKLESCGHLSELVLAENRLESLSDDVFDGATALEILDLCDNQLEKFPSSLWRAPALTTLRAVRNRIKSLGFEASQDDDALPFLTFIDLSNNELEAFDADLPAILIAVRDLNLSRNKLRELPSSIKCMHSIQRLNVCENQLERLTEGLAGIASLHELLLSYNENLGQDADDSDFDVLGHCISLHTLAMQRCGLSAVPSCLSRLPYLRILYLAENRLQEFDLRAPSFQQSGLPRFGPCILDLSMNEFRSLPEAVLDMAGLEDLRMHDNCLSALPPKNVFSKRMKCIQSLSLTVDADQADCVAFAKHLETTHGGIVRIYIDHREGYIAYESQNAHKGERGPGVGRYAQAASCIKSKSLAGPPPGFAQITGTSSHVLEDRLLGGRVTTCSADCYALFDGHAGPFAAEFAQTRLLGLIDSIADERMPIEESLTRALALVNASMKKAMDGLQDKKVQSSGSTVVVILVDDDKIACANAGDSRAILVTFEEGKVCAERLTKDDKPGDPEERQRIRAVGGYLVDRVKPGTTTKDSCRLTMPLKNRNGFQSLGVSRSLGDFPCAPALSGEPHVVVRARGEHDRYLVLVCDGITDVLSDAEIAEFIMGELRREPRPRMHKTKGDNTGTGGGGASSSGSADRGSRNPELERIALMLCLHARGLGSIDDASVMIIDLGRR